MGDTRKPIGRMTRRLVAAIVIVAVTGCGGDDAGAPEDGGSSTPPADSEPAVDDTVAATLGDAEIVALTGQEICDGLTADDVGSTLDVTVDDAQAYDTSTAQCTYGVTTPDGGVTSITVASMHPDIDLGGRAGDEAFDHVVAVNLSLGGDTEVDHVDLGAGDRSSRLTGPSLHFGIVGAGGHLFTAVVPTDIAASQVDTLMDVIASRLA